jgi:hypothetical protein
MSRTAAVASHARPLAIEHPRWPAHRFYWALLDDPAHTGTAAGVRRRLPGGRFVTSGRSRVRLGYLFESHLPVPIESVHAVYLRLGQGRALACALSDDAFAEHRDALTLGPASLQAFLSGLADPEELNLLTGPWEPARVRGARRRWRASVALGVSVLIALGAWGAERRVGAWNSRRAEAHAAIDAIHAEVLPADGAVSRAPAPVAFTAELRTLRRTRSGADAPPVSRDAAVTLAALCDAWPPEVEARVETLAVSHDAVRIGALMPSRDAARRLAAAVGRFAPGWSMSQPELGALREGVRLRLSFERTGAPE